MINLDNNVAIVTGAARGLGKGISQKLAQLGAQVIVSDVNQEGLEATQAEFLEQGLKTDIFNANTADASQAQQLINYAVEKYGKIDILVNNAGINRDSMIHKMTQQQWDDVISVNLTGVYNCLQPAAVKMREQKSGRIINISSIAWFGNVGQANYSAAKAGVIGLTRTASKELAKYGVTVNAISPGFIETDMTRSVPEKVWDIMVSKIPMGRAGKPEDVANVISFLSSDAASYVTGEVINVGGGMTL